MCWRSGGGKGTFVAEELPAAGMDLSSLTGLRARERARDLFEMRLIFEPATVALACQRASMEELQQIQKKAERMEQIAAAGGDWPLADQEFHWAIIRASHNEYMRRLYPIINNAVNDLDAAGSKPPAHGGDGDQRQQADPGVPAAAG